MWRKSITTLSKIRYVVDFRIGNTLLEVYGDYWHGEKMSPSNKRRDKAKEKYLANAYDLIVIQESQIIKNPQSIIKQLCELKK